MSSPYREAAINAHQLERLGVTLDLGGRSLVLFATLLVLSTVFLGWQVGAFEYGRKVPVTGSIDFSHARQVVASDFGVIKSLAVSEGQAVSIDSHLLRVGLKSDDEAVTALVTELDVQADEFNKQLAAATANHATAIRDYEQALISHKAQLALLQADIGLQQEKVAHLDEHLNRTRVLREGGLMSNLDWISFRTNLITEQQKLNQLEQQRLHIRAQIRETRVAARKSGLSFEENHAQLQIQQSRVRQERRQLLDSQHRTFRSPISGYVSRLEVTLGDSVFPGQTLLHLSETGNERNENSVTATLMVPAEAVGYMTAGQRLDLNIDALPVTEFGRLNAVVSQLADHPIAAQDDSPGFFPARLHISEAELGAFSDKLSPGMSVTTFVRTDRRPVTEWLLRPLIKLWEGIS